MWDYLGITQGLPGDYLCDDPGGETGQNTGKLEPASLSTISPRNTTQVTQVKVSAKYERWRVSALGRVLVPPLHLLGSRYYR